MISLSKRNTTESPLNYTALTALAAARRGVDIAAMTWSEDKRGFVSNKKTAFFAPLTDAAQAFELMTHCRLEPRFMTKTIQILEVCEDDHEHKLLEHPIGARGLAASLQEALVRAAAKQQERQSR